jgi:hypothetical protein
MDYSTLQDFLYQPKLSPVPHFRSNKSLLHPGSECCRAGVHLPVNAFEALRRHAEAHARLQAAEKPLPSHTQLRQPERLVAA